MENEIIEIVKNLVSIIKSNNLKSISIQSKELSIQIESSEIFNIEKKEFIEAHQKDKPPSNDEVKENGNYIFVKAPLIGTFYRAPSPDSSPFVEIGDIVEPKQTLCIIEAMKVMNEITVEKRCKIIDIYPENGEMVEFGKNLFKVELLAE
ncbi:MAG: acetyl-CoA carboxylase, biotin carboxyl carrier protein [Caldisericia bacterium]|jgi:acetyl-CoA carboxylase biotin carboxyl carrier protein|nr:acetyl-CoA carboxylase, biotin carboxyl carrier protein [Caldisericia bacterium]HOJ16804.1 acetyl-CoA carboxylase, biotin carboxyl carrier protein [Caldisericia bacterium]HPO29110.1 acetyl-CoA carboxylase, biotin carboxyl carrier protein [Caldisericia bacterium]HQG82409.1 acetyl-CoA carboxylase, biotin carboxyl carrier protein [Caldisericia bacterium]HXK70996.1 acetyl-CoA carboxylase, biotin carboxyl carrier protein [Caldisericia bacterium]